MVSTALTLGVTLAVLAVVTGLGVAASRGRVRSVDDYLTARGSAGPRTTAASLVASSMGAWILFTPAEAGATYGGLAVLGYAVGSALPLLLFVSVGPRVRDAIPHGHSLTEYVHARYGARMYAYVLCVTAFYMFIFLAAEMTAITGALAFVADVPAWLTATVIGVAVLAYTGYGGLVASIVTDTVQALVVLPLLAIGFVAAVRSLGGVGDVHRAVVATHPEFLSPTFGPGLAFGAYVTIAVLGANAFNQGQWQRVYAAESASAVRRGFALAAVTVVPTVLLAGLFGVAAAGLGALGDASPSLALFLLVEQTLPDWALLGATVVAVLLVMSTADTLFNALASLVTVELPRLLADPSDDALKAWARGLTVVVALAAVFVGAQGYSVLTLFLLADLLGAATIAPFLHGLYSRRATETGALTGSVAGLAVGLAYFPMLRGPLAAVPLVGPALPAPSFLASFLGALVVSTAGTVLVSRVTATTTDVDRLGDAVQTLGDDEEVAG